ncbi:putative mitochondrial protein [Cucumis melo var. makuwa]|uniref:Mitochondrial protein n=1 Tax=Cucumis melo var. makuwa TaxID=1194695 RepID=A0A5D3C5Q9_CUCMM|nr:putative mitochondrial protein [Cucumis melo var. makuwa]TYK07167.1 putative mitochondrial protein [Cucumis melo var. makuwa]
MNTLNLNHVPAYVAFLAMEHNIKSFHTSFSSPRCFFTNTSVEFFPLSKSTSDTKLAQSAPAPANSNQLSTFNDVPKPTPDTSLCRSTRWPLLQMDVKNVFLIGTLSKEVYMKPPLRTYPPPHNVCLIRQALYGLK